MESICPALSNLEGNSYCPVQKWMWSSALFYNSSAFQSVFIDVLLIYSFSRSVEGIDPYPQDLPLNTGYYFQFGLGRKSRG